MIFHPTIKMEATRKAARGLYDLGLRMVGEWARKIPDFSLSEWKEWEQSEGFLDWWSEVFPEHAGICLADLRALEFEANRTLMMALAEGDVQAAKVVVQIVTQAKQAQGSTDMSLEEWFTSADKGTNGWAEA